MKHEQQLLRNYILELILRDDPDYVSKAMDALGMARSTVYHYVSQAVSDQLLIKDSNRACGYSLLALTSTFSYKVTAALDEDTVYVRDIQNLLGNLPDSVRDIWSYGFAGMMSNAIEHSGAGHIQCDVSLTPVDTRMTIRDDGVGIFRHIHDYLLQTTGEEIPEPVCAGYLLAGRFTTNPLRHSGEGIFFTSHVMDEFVIRSHGVTFTRDNFADTQHSAESADESGTVLTMSLSNNSRKSLREVMDRFASVDEGFFRTQIPMSHLFPSGFPVSRSEARRLMYLIKPFREVILDFTGVRNLGQGFTHEFWKVQLPQYPDIRIVCENACDDVSYMIGRTLNTH